MPRTPSFKVRDTPKGWLLHIPASLSDTGKLQRRYFSTRDLATAEAKKVRNDYRAHGEQASVLPPRVADDAVAALRVLEPTGATLLEAARSYLKMWAARNSSQLLGDAVIAFTTAKAETIREETAKSYAYTLERTMSSLHESVLADVTTEDLASILSEKKPTARAMHIRNLRVFWRWACKEPRQWATMAPVDALEFRKEAGEADIISLSAAEVKALLKAAEEFRPEAAIAFAVSIFGGVRSKELTRLTWASVLEDHIEIGRSVAKKHARRLVPICPTLRAWLDAYRGDAGAEDLLTGGNWRSVSCAVRRLAGWAVESKLLQHPPSPSRGAWPANGCRHTCASVQVAIGTPLEDLTFKFGHTGGHDVLRKHYVARMSKKEALEILSTGPNGTVVSLVSVA
ncbi:hypothetical protein OKA04_15785 [Luteolibacter flavescens]|uniref:Tyr recombinase domain-containing protein n=1 Tax=Luteolibacter flavescens TaxID=1859460 RepID=A0ABT3FSB1_9BACT|nr:hypothetical protein [Luteolibacter flavescens]MCW1886199.1 hypothetical protein [Luteolibacter flavescens]